jgi:nitrogenase molybdenum-iron protein alpha chain
MAINLRTPQAETREQRLGTITQWEGRAQDLARDSAFTYGCGRDCGPGGRRLCELSSPYSQATMCAEQIAVTNATIIKDTVVIQHSPIG